MKIAIVMTSMLALAACGGGSGTAPAVALSVATLPISIAEVQGSAAASPLAGQVVTVSGIVTGDFQSRDADPASDLGGFYLQEDPPDGNPDTSDGVFVFDGLNPATDVAPGDRVTVRGTVQEYFGETQIVDPEVSVTGTGKIVPVDISLPASASMANSDGDPLADLEQFEGMLVRFPQSLTVTDLHDLERFGAVALSQGGRLYQFTNGNPPDAAAYAASATGGVTIDIMPK